MSTTTKKVLLTVVLVIAGYFALKILLGLAIHLIWTALPVIVVVGVVYALYHAYGKKALGGGNRRTLL